MDRDVARTRDDLRSSPSPVESPLVGQAEVSVESSKDAGVAKPPEEASKDVGSAEEDRAVVAPSGPVAADSEVSSPFTVGDCSGVGSLTISASYRNKVST